LSEVCAKALELRAVLEEIMPPIRAKYPNFDSWEAKVEFQRAVAAKGWTAPAWPVEIGGKGLSLEEQLECDAEFSRVGAPQAPSVYGVKNVGPTIAAVGNDEQKKHLRGITEATELWCQGFSEPDFGSDLGGLRCRADLDGDTFVINGQKVWTSIGMHATHCMLLVRTDQNAAKHKGISALLVPLDLPGISRRPIKQINGHAEFAEMFFEDVRVPKSALLGPLHDGWRVTMATLEFERSGVITLAGALTDAIDDLVKSDALKNVTPVMRDRVMKLYSQGRILNMMGEQVLAEALGKGSSGTASSLIKLVWSQLGRSLSEVRMDIAGLEAAADFYHPVAQAFMGGRSNTIAGGTTEVMKNLIGERALGLPREPK
jgi:alkylation response protein AidB-like acyl-CoA dehydrogenase